MWGRLGTLTKDPGIEFFVLRSLRNVYVPTESGDRERCKILNYFFLFTLCLDMWSPSAGKLPFNSILEWNWKAMCHYSKFGCLRPALH
jgi:hypothetical protein